MKTAAQTTPPSPGGLLKTVPIMLPVGLLLFACAGQQSPHSTSVGPFASEAGAASALALDDAAHGSRSLSPELLYDLLVADIARRRGQHRTALAAMTRAAERSHHPGLVRRAIRLALHTRAFHQAVELSRLLTAITPDDIPARLMLANAQLQAGQSRAAIALLLELAAAQPLDSSSVLQEISRLLAQKPPADGAENAAPNTLLDDFLTAADARGELPQLWLTAALTAFRLEQHARFRSLLRRSLVLQPDWEVAAIMLLTDLYERNGDQYRPYALERLQHYPEQARFRTHYAALLLQQSHTDDTLEQLEIVLQQGGDVAQAQYIAALIYFERLEYTRAQPLLESFLRTNPDSDQARLYLSEIYRQQQDPAAAAALLHAVHSPRYYLDAQIALARVKAEQSGVEAGIRHLQSVDSHDPQQASRLVLEQHLMLRDYQQPARAKQVLDRALEKQPNQPDFLYSRGLLAAEMQLLELHERDMRALIKIQPDNAHAYNALGYTLADRTERYPEALQLITKALELMPDSPFILDSMGWLQYRLGDYPTAIRFLRRALALKKDVEIAAHLGEALWVIGKKQEAHQIWAMGRDWSPDSTLIIDTINRLTKKDRTPGTT